MRPQSQYSKEEKGKGREMEEFDAHVFGLQWDDASESDVEVETQEEADVQWASRIDRMDGRDVYERTMFEEEEEPNSDDFEEWPAIPVNSPPRTRQEGEDDNLEYPCRWFRGEGPPSGGRTMGGGLEEEKDGRWELEWKEGGKEDGEVELGRLGDDEERASDLGEGEWYRFGDVERMGGVEWEVMV